MAEPKKTTKKQRRVKDPQTFRERAIQANENEGKTTKKHRVRKVLLAPFVFIGRALGKIFSTIYKRSPKLLQKVFRAIGLVLLPPYVRNSWKELKQVTWPTWTEARRLTFAVLIFATIFGLIVAGVDYGLTQVFKKILLS